MPLLRNYGERLEQRNSLSCMECLMLAALLLLYSRLHHHWNLLSLQQMFASAGDCRHMPHMLAACAASCPVVGQLTTVII